MADPAEPDEPAADPRARPVDSRQRLPVDDEREHREHVPQALTTSGSSFPHNNMQPYLVLNFVIAISGRLPCAVLNSLLFS